MSLVFRGCSAYIKFRVFECNPACLRPQGACSAKVPYGYAPVRKLTMTVTAFTPRAPGVIAAPRDVAGPVMPGVRRTPGRPRASDTRGRNDPPSCSGHRVGHINKDDDPSYKRSQEGGDTQHWDDAMEGEMNNLKKI